MSGEEQPKTEDAETDTCYRCGAVLEPGERVCSYCGRKQYRLCYCGAEVPKSADQCPECGADWSKASRRRRLAEHFEWRKMVKFCATGAGLALVLSAIVVKLYQSLLGQAVTYYAGTGREPSPGLVLSYIGEKLGRMFGAAAGDSSGLLWALLAIAIGAGGGAFYYLWRVRLARQVRRRTSKGRRRASSS